MKTEKTQSRRGSKKKQKREKTEGVRRTREKPRKSAQNLYTPGPGSIKEGGYCKDVRRKKKASPFQKLAQRCFRNPLQVGQGSFKVRHYACKDESSDGLGLHRGIGQKRADQVKKP